MPGLTFIKDIVLEHVYDVSHQYKNYVAFQ